MWGEFLSFDIFFHTKAWPKLIGNWFCTPIISKNPIKTCFWKVICVCVCVWIETVYLLLENQALMRFVKITGKMHFFFWFNVFYPKLWICWALIWDEFYFYSFHWCNRQDSFRYSSSQTTQQPRDRRQVTLNNKHEINYLLQFPLV